MTTSSRLEEYERAPFFGGNPDDATRNTIWKLFQESPYFDLGEANGPQFSYQLLPQNENVSGQAPAYVLFKFIQKDHTSELHRVYYISGSGQPELEEIDLLRAGLVFPMLDVYHVLQTKYILATDCLVMIGEHLKNMLNNQKKAEKRIEISLSSGQQKENDQRHDVRDFFRGEDEVFGISHLLNRTINKFDFDEEFR
jgi:hypothetical protein